MRNEKLDDGNITLGVRISKELHARMIEIAKEKDLSLSQLVRQACKAYIAKEETN